MNIGLFGGSFDPVHKGHLSMIRSALKSGIVDIVIVIPVCRNSFKRGTVISPAPYRFYMTDETLRDEFKKNVFCSDIEFHIDGISYTALTLEKIEEESYISTFLSEKGVTPSSGPHSFYWICGSDILPSFDKWYRTDIIASKAKLLVAKRPGENVDIDLERSRLKGLIGDDLEIVEFKIKGVKQSSSDIRDSGSFDDIPKAALDFIREHDLYNAQKIFDDVSDETASEFYDIAVKLYPYLRKKRLLHTLNVGLLSAYYAKCHGADIRKALIAGALHDCAKELDIELQRKMAHERSGDLFENEKLLHSPAGAVMAREVFGIEDEEILDAITYHTTGRGEMTLLDKIVYLADKLEPSRTYTDLRPMRAIAGSDLDGALRLCASAVKEKFEKSGRDIHPITKDFMKSIGLMVE